MFFFILNEGFASVATAVPSSGGTHNYTLLEGQGAWLPIEKLFIFICVLFLNTLLSIISSLISCYLNNKYQ
jgi:hypothetical protein